MLQNKTHSSLIVKGSVSWHGWEDSVGPPPLRAQASSLSPLLRWFALFPPMFCIWCSGLDGCYCVTDGVTSGVRNDDEV